MSDPREDLEDLGYDVTIKEQGVAPGRPRIVEAIAVRDGVRTMRTGLSEKAALEALAYLLVVPELRAESERVAASLAERDQREPRLKQAIEALLRQLRATGDWEAEARELEEVLAGAANKG